MSSSGKESVPGQPQTDEESSRSYFSLSKAHSLPCSSLTVVLFEIEIEDLSGLIEQYQKRTFVEDLDYLQKDLGGTLPFKP